MMTTLCYYLSLRKKMMLGWCRKHVASYDFVLQSGWLDFSKLTLCSLVDSYLIVHSKLYKHFLCYFFLFFNFVFNRLILIYASQTCPSFIILYVHSNLRSQFISKKKGCKVWVGCWCSRCILQHRCFDNSFICYPWWAQTVSVKVPLNHEERRRELRLFWWGEWPRVSHYVLMCVLPRSWPCSHPTHISE